MEERKQLPSLDAWLQEAKADPDSTQVGMYLFHNGTVRKTAKAQVREGNHRLPPVQALRFSYDEEKLAEAIAATKALPGIYYVRAWVNSGTLPAGADLMLLLVGGDIRPHVTQALQFLLDRVKTLCVKETELYAPDTAADPE